MPNLIRPDLKALVWLSIGFFLVPVALKMFRQ